MLATVTVAMLMVVLAAMSAAEMMAKSVAVRGAVEGQSPERGKVEKQSPGPTSMGPSRPRNSVRNPGTGLSGGVVESPGPLARSAGPGGPAEGRPGPSDGSGRNSE